MSVQPDATVDIRRAAKEAKRDHDHKAKWACGVDQGARPVSRSIRMRYAFKKKKKKKKTPIC